LVASIGSRATAHGRSSFVGADLDVREVLEQLRAEVAWLHSNTDARLAIVDAAGLTIGGDDGLAAVASSAEGTALGEGLGWRVLAAPRDPEASARSAAWRVQVLLGLVATCVLIGLGSVASSLRSASRTA